MSVLTGRLPGADRAAGQLLAYFVRYRGRFARGLSCVVLTTAIGLAGPWVLKYAVDDLTAGVTRSKLAFYAGLFLAIALAGGAARFAMRRILINASRLIEYDIRNAFYAHLQTLPLAFFHAHRTGDLMSRATSDLSAVRQMVGPAVMYSASTSLTFVVAIVLMLSINARLTLIALLPLPLITLTARYFGRAIHVRFERIQAQLSDVSAVTQEALAGVRVLRAYRQEGAELDRFRRANLEYVQRNRALIQLQGLYFPSMGLFMGIAEMIVLWLGARDVINGRMSVGELVAFNGYLMMLVWPMIAFGWVTNLVQRGRASWERLLQVFDTPAAIDDRDVAHPEVTPDRLTGAIEIRDLTFAFGDRPVLEHIAVQVAAGQTVAFVGRTGAGKSTLLALLARLHDPPPGTVFLDGMDVRTLPLATVRGAIAMVPQEPFLFSTTIAQNVGFAAADGVVDQARVEAVAAIARIDRDVADFPAGYETRVGERGITLSGGQKQRTAIARALYTDPRILILDDALSAVDTSTEEEVLKGLRTVRAGRTTLVVAHRVSTVRDADLIVVLDGGRVVERGTHAALVAAGGLYAAMHRQQQLEAELAAS